MPLLRGLLRRRAVEHAAAAALCRGAPLPAGHPRRGAGGLRAGHRQPGERRRQLSCSSTAVSASRRSACPARRGRRCCRASTCSLVLWLAARHYDRVSATAGWPRCRAGSRAIRLARLWRLGFPAASQISIEVGAFALATALAGRLDPVSSASHQIALNIAATAFMVPLGCRLGRRRARRQPRRRARPRRRGAGRLDGHRPRRRRS